MPDMLVLPSTSSAAQILGGVRTRGPTLCGVGADNLGNGTCLHAVVLRVWRLRHC